MPRSLEAACPSSDWYPSGEDRGDKCPVLAVCSVETAALLVLLAGPAGARVIAPELMRGCGRGRQAPPAVSDPPGIQRRNPRRDQVRGSLREVVYGGLVLTVSVAL